MPLYNVRVDMPIEAENAKEAALVFRRWLVNSEDPLLPVVSVRRFNFDGPGEYYPEVSEFDLQEEFFKG